MQIFRIIPVLLVVLFAAVLPGCGKSGPLYLPPVDDTPAPSTSDKTD